MRHRLSIAALTLGLAVAGAAHAQSNSDQRGVTVNGSVTQLCVLGAPNPSTINLGQMATTSGTRTGKLATITDQSVQLPTSFCNYAGTQISIAATALVEQDTTVPPAGFAKAVNFTANVTGWTTSAASVTTTAAFDGSNPTTNGSGPEENAPESTNLTLTLTNFTAPGDGILIAGSYSGLVTVTLGPDGGS
jgi:hypothetical protein